MTLYNKGRFVEEAVRSVLANTFTDLELLVVDDASTDDGPERVRRIVDPRIRLLTTDRNRGRPSAANRGYDAARGEFIAVLDGDDIMHQDRLAKQVAFLDAQPEVDAVGTSISAFGVFNELWHWPLTDEECKGKMLFNDPVCYGTAMFRRERLLASGARCNESWLQPGMDYLFLLSMASHVRFANIHEPLTFYRTGEQNMRHGGEPKSARDALYREGFRMFGIAASEEEVQLQLMLHQMFPIAVGPVLVTALHEWIVKLKSINRERGLFPVRVFEAELDRRWRRSFHPIADRDLRAALTHMKLERTREFARYRYLAAAAFARLFPAKAKHASA